MPMGDTLVDIELVWGSMGDDVFKASEGPDYVHGDTGSDTMSYELSDMGVTVNLGADQDANGRLTRMRLTVMKSYAD